MENVYLKYTKILKLSSVYKNEARYNLLVVSYLKRRFKSFLENFEIHFIGSHSDVLQKIIEDNKLNNCVKQNGRFSRKN